MNDLPELPILEDASVETLRRKGTLLRNLPAKASLEVPELYFTNTRALEAEQYANDVRAAFDISRQYEKRSRAIAKARNYQAQKFAEKNNQISKRFANR